MANELLAPIQTCLAVLSPANEEPQPGDHCMPLPGDEAADGVRPRDPLLALPPEHKTIDNSI